MTPTAANRLELDYREEATKLRRSSPLIDMHSHIGDRESAEVFRDVMELFDVEHIFTMTQLEEAPGVKEALGDKVHFITFPKFRGDDPVHEHTDGYLERIKSFQDLGARIVKFWAAPRGIDFGKELGKPDLMRLDAPHRVKQIQYAAEQGLMIMVHVGDPNTWFQTKYVDSSIYGTKEDQYKPLLEFVQQYDVPWIAAHMGGNPEDLRFLGDMLDKHENLYLDSSATKWIVRELSKYQQGELQAFLTDYKGRIMFGSDIVTMKTHLSEDQDEWDMGNLASGRESAFELYSSRYFALRALFESEYRGESPIADPDLALVDPKKYTPQDAPALFGHNLSDEILAELYHGAARRLLKQQQIPPFGSVE